MDRAQMVLLALPLFLFFTDIVNLFTPPPPKPAHHQQPQVHFQPKSQPILQEPLDFPSKSSGIGGIGPDSTIHISFCASCSYRGTAMTMKNMLESSFPGVEVILSNYPPPLPKRLLSKAVPVVQIGIVATIVAGEHIFPRLGIMTPPPWYYSLRANRFGSIASTWLFGNFIQSFLQSSGAFEVHCNGEMVFSKLKEQRFPGEIELRDIIGRKLSASRIVDNTVGVWS